MRVFLDTNAIVSAFASRGLCADLFEVVLLEHELMTGEAVIAELRRALREKVKLPARRCEEIESYLRQVATTCAQSASFVSARVDADDALVLAEALAGRSEIFVAGDAAVQRLAELEWMKILSPRDFWDFLHSRVK